MNCFIIEFIYLSQYYKFNYLCQQNGKSSVALVVEDVTVKGPYHSIFDF